MTQEELLMNYTAKGQERVCDFDCFDSLGDAKKTGICEFRGRPEYARLKIAPDIRDSA